MASRVLSPIGGLCPQLRQNRSGVGRSLTVRSRPRKEENSSESLRRSYPSIADLFQVAFDAAGLSRLADTPSMPDDLMRKQNPAVLRYHFHQILLDFLRVGILRHVQPR